MAVFNTNCAGRRVAISPRAALMTLSALLAPAMLFAQETDAAKPGYLDDLKTCQLLSDDAERLACFDAKVAAIITANEAGDVRVVDREDVIKTRRSLFGFNVPDVGILKDEEPEKDEDGKDKLFETTITSVRYFSSKRARFTTQEGAVWEMNSIPRRLARIKPGAVAVFKPGSFNYFFIRIDGQLGVKGRRVQ